MQNPAEWLRRRFLRKARRAEGPLRPGDSLPKAAPNGLLAPLQRWPIQLWRSRVTHDPTGLRGRFKAAFDRGLFTGGCIAARIAGLEGRIVKTLGEAGALLDAGKPRAAHVKARHAMNDAILALHWRCGELPRSQNRTGTRLRRLCAEHAIPGFYALYREVFGLAGTTKVIRQAWPEVKEEVLQIAARWGDSARDFFRHAVDSDFAWGQNGGILSVYRLFIPVIVGFQGTFLPPDRGATGTTQHPGETAGGGVTMAAGWWYCWAAIRRRTLASDEKCWATEQWADEGGVRARG